MNPLSSSVRRSLINHLTQHVDLRYEAEIVKTLPVGPYPGLPETHIGFSYSRN